MLRLNGALYVLMLQIRIKANIALMSAGGTNYLQYVNVSVKGHLHAKFVQMWEKHNLAGF